MFPVFRTVLAVCCLAPVLVSVPVTLARAQDAVNPVAEDVAPAENYVDSYDGELEAFDAIPAENSTEGIVFLELFSSESCPFSPGAERNFSDIIVDSDVVGLTCMVDYFDSGKPSPLSRPFCQDQQDVFVHMLKSGSNYTPQLVINGTAQVAGQDLQKVSDAIKKVRDSGNLPQEVEIRLGVESGSYDVVLPLMSEGSGKYVLRITLIKQVPTLSSLSGAIQQQERTPRNVATSLIEGGIWNGKRTIWTIRPKADGVADAFIVTIQDQTSGRVMAAGKMDLLTSLK